MEGISWLTVKHSHEEFPVVIAIWEFLYLEVGVVMKNEHAVQGVEEQ